jgi:protein-L-isoaspartate(D-aspartate) O-methyltransferase
MNFEQARVNMVEQQIRPWEVLDQTVLDVIASLPREQFVPVAYRELAYSDTEIPIDHGQIMMTPKVEARMLQAINVQLTDRVLEIGTGTGYLTALLSRLGGHVTSIEIFDEFCAPATAKLGQVGATNTEVVCGDAIDGWASGAPYDAIAVTASAPDRRREIEQQLTVGGRLFIVTGESPVMEAQLITRLGHQEFTFEVLFETVIPALVGAEPTAEFRF